MMTTARREEVETDDKTEKTDPAVMTEKEEPKDKMEKKKPRGTTEKEEQMKEKPKKKETKDNQCRRVRLIVGRRSY